MLLKSRRARSGAIDSPACRPALALWGSVCATHWRGAVWRLIVSLGIDLDLMFAGGGVGVAPRICEVRCGTPGKKRACFRICPASRSRRNPRPGTRQRYGPWRDRRPLGGEGRCEFGVFARCPRVSAAGRRGRLRRPLRSDHRRDLQHNGLPLSGRSLVAMGRVGDTRHVACDMVTPRPPGRSVPAQTPCGHAKKVGRR